MALLSSVIKPYYFKQTISLAAINLLNHYCLCAFRVSFSTGVYLLLGLT